MTDRLLELLSHPFFRSPKAPSRRAGLKKQILRRLPAQSTRTSNNIGNPWLRRQILGYLTRTIEDGFKKYGTLLKFRRHTKMPYSIIRFILSKKYGVTSLAKIKRALGVKKSLSTRKKAKIITVKKLYDELATLEAVGQKLGITRERVRQLLIQGQNEGLFDYKHTSEKRFEELIRCYDRGTLLREMEILGKIPKICLKLNITQSEFYKLLDHFNINVNEYKALLRRRKCINEYQKIFDALGHHPTTTEMSARPDWRNVWAKIDRYWGKMNRFRQEYGIVMPKKKWPEKARNAWQLAMKMKSERKQQKKQKVLEFLKSGKPHSITGVFNTLMINKQSLYQYLTELIDEGKVDRVGVGSGTKYQIKALTLAPSSSTTQ